MTGLKRKSATQKLREDAILTALLATGSVAGAATVSGLSESTVRRLLNGSGSFRRRLDRARNSALQAIVSGLVGSAPDALAALKRNLSCGTPSVEVKAASVILGSGPMYDTHRAGSDEIAELKAKIAAIESMGGKP